MCTYLKNLFIRKKRGDGGEEKGRDTDTVHLLVDPPNGQKPKLNQAETCQKLHPVSQVGGRGSSRTTRWELD